MARMWEIRGLFGNEYAMEQAAEELKKHEGLEPKVLDRRNLSVRMARRDEKTEEVVRRTFEIYHGFVEAEAPLGHYDKGREKARQKKVKAALKKAKARAKSS